MELSRLGFISRYFLVAFTLLTLSACGSGGGDSSGNQPPVTYTIGGTVSGLTGTLMLQNNGADDLTISTDGNFSFSTAISNSSNYSVSISSQPADQICNISSGTGNGTVAQSNITNVTVECATLYTLGGTVTGLSGTLVLQNNYNYELTTITGGDNFTFNTQIADHSGYYVSVSTQPRDQYCVTTSNYAGTVNGSDISNVTVECGPAFNIGGSVTGLNGTLRLHLDGGDDLTLSADGNFLFNTQKADLGRYDVYITSQPDNQFCRLTNYTGTVAGGDITDVLLTCGANPLARIGQYGNGIHYGTAIVGNIAYIATSIGLLIEDITDPANPVVLASYEIPVGGRQITVNGAYAYVGTDKLYVFNIENPTAPYEVAQLDIQAASQTVLNGNHLYILDSSSLRVIDISDPAQPALVNTLDIPTYNGSLKICGNYACIVDFNNGLYIYSISNPAEPTLVGSFTGDELRYPKSVAIRGQYAYVADFSYGIKILDISNPANPVYFGNYELAGQSYAIEIKGDYAYVANYYSIQVLNISNPAAITVAGSSDAGSSTVSIKLDGNRAYMQGLFTGSPTVILDISTPSSPGLVGQYYGSGGSIGYTRAMAINGNYAYLGGDDLNIIDITDPANPQPAVVYNNSRVNDIVIDNNLAYLAGNDLEILNITNPLAPSRTGINSSVNSGYGLTLNGIYAYVADYNDGLRIFDITTPSAPTQTALFDTSGQAEDVAVNGNYAYIADNSGGLRILDISQPATPVEVSAITGYQTIRYPDKIVLNGNYAYLNGNSTIIDISDPTTPVALDTRHRMTYFQEIVISNNLAFMVRYSGLSVFDISDPLVPVEIAAHTTRASPRDVVVIGNTVYVAAYGYGLEIFEFTPP